MFAEKDPARAKATLAELKTDTDEALETLRDLARGIYPPLLADKGLSLAREDGQLTFAVSDDGAGFDQATVELGSGLQNMTDRLEALGGRVDLSSAPGRGTTIEGRVPAVVAVEGPQPL